MNDNIHHQVREICSRHPEYLDLLERHRRLLATQEGALNAGDDYLPPHQRAYVDAELERVAAELAAIEQEHYHRIVGAHAAFDAKAKVRDERRAYAKAKAEGTLPPPTPQTPIADVGGFDNNGNPL